MSWRLHVFSHDKPQDSLFEIDFSGGLISDIISKNQGTRAEFREVASSRQKKKVWFVKHAYFPDSSSQVFFADHPIAFGWEYFVALSGAHGEAALVLIERIAKDFLFLVRFLWHEVDYWCVWFQSHV